MPVKRHVQLISILQKALQYAKGSLFVLQHPGMTAVRLYQLDNRVGQPAANFQKVTRFFDENRDARLDQRGMDQLIDAIRGERIYLLEDIDANILGCIFRFVYFGGNYEIGGALITCGGFGLHRVLVAAASIDLLIFDSPDRIFCSTSLSSESIHSNITDCGFMRFDIDNSTRRIFEKPDVPFPNGTHFFHIPSNRREKAIGKCGKILIDLYNSGFISKEGAQISISIDIPTINELRIREYIKKFICEN